MNNLELKTIEVEGKVIPVTDSRLVAENAGIRHTDLLRKIKGYEEILENAKVRSQNYFIKDTYKVEGNNKTYDCYQLTKLGCEMVANKMTGKKGVLFTATYVQAFNQMQEQLTLGKEQKAIEGLNKMVEDMQKNLIEQKETIEEYKSMCKISCSKKRNYTDYIKKRLGITKANSEFEQVKARVFLILNINKWEDVELETSKNILNVIDESITVIKRERPYKQMSYFDEAIG
ncbi:Rha family transcriptional regulator [Clostridium perfringens]|uniref:Rha family transcriptional regulator n=1 Tax=Clostridium perfringens TaxID=1502 RepID=UPI00096A7C84|nr:Rha family transcriptional regulator [Clostridium perfringens]